MPKTISRELQTSPHENAARLLNMLLKHLLTIILIISPATAQAQSSTAPAEGVLQRLMPHLAPQFQLALIPRPGTKTTFALPAPAATFASKQPRSPHFYMELTGI